MCAIPVFSTILDRTQHFPPIALAGAIAPRLVMCPRRVEVRSILRIDLSNLIAYLSTPFPPATPYSWYIARFYMSLCKNLISMPSFASSSTNERYLCCESTDRNVSRTNGDVISPEMLKC